MHGRAAREDRPLVRTRTSRRERGDVTRLTALVLLTAAFAPAAVIGALPVVVPVVVVLTGLGLAVAAFEPVPVEVSEPVGPAASPTR